MSSEVEITSSLRILLNALKKDHQRIWVNSKKRRDNPIGLAYMRQMHEHEFEYASLCVLCMGFVVAAVVVVLECALKLCRVLNFNYFFRFVSGAKMDGIPHNLYDKIIKVHRKINKLPHFYLFCLHACVIRMRCVNAAMVLCCARWIFNSL